MSRDSLLYHVHVPSGGMRSRQHECDQICRVQTHLRATRAIVVSLGQKGEALISGDRRMHQALYLLLAGERATLAEEPHDVIDRGCIAFFAANVPNLAEDELPVVLGENGLEV